VVCSVSNDPGLNGRPIEVSMKVAELPTTTPIEVTSVFIFI
jgi:hypothetical protein